MKQTDRSGLDLLHTMMMMTLTMLLLPHSLRLCHHGMVLPCSAG
jgi:hypothetical protein